MQNLSPYGADGEDLAELIEVARRDGLHVDVCPSVWCPPYTIGIRFTDNTNNPPKRPPATAARKMTCDEDPLSSDSRCVCVRDFSGA